MSLRGRLILKAIELLPEKEISRLVRRAADLPVALVIREFAKAYGVNLEEAEKPIGEYRSLLDFFTRRLKPGRAADRRTARRLGLPGRRGARRARGRIDGDRVQAKGREYSVAALLADSERARRFEGGTFFTLYLSPKDYHRVHSPADAVVTGYTYVPGALFPVNPNAVANVDSLFAKNERLITHLSSGALRADGLRDGGRDLRGAHQGRLRPRGGHQRRGQAARAAELSASDPDRARR